VETNLQILFNLLGTPEKDKHLLLYETGHSVWLVNESRKDRLDFLDKYLGPPWSPLTPARGEVRPGRSRLFSPAGRTSRACAFRRWRRSSGRPLSAT
jgi:hypothetical protein